MSQIEPMSIEKIKWLVARYRAHLARGIDSTTWGDLGPSLALAWAEAEARARYHADPTVDHHEGLYSERIAPFLDAVLGEIGWPEDNR